MSQNLKPIVGAADYRVAILADGKFAVLMNYEEKGTQHFDEIQMCKTREAAIKAADRWQKRENAAVTKAQKAAPLTEKPKQPEAV